MPTLRYKENTAGAVKPCQLPTCISLEDINNVRNSKEPCKSKMAQISEEMGSLSHPSPDFCYDKHTRSQKNDRMVSQYLALCNLTAYFFCGWLYSTICHRHPPLSPIKNGLMGGEAGVPEHRWCAVTCRPCNSRERHRLQSYTPEEASHTCRQDL